MILILNGSPNKNSKTMQITNLLLKNNTSSIKVINAYDKKVDSCRDCKYCDHAIGCSRNDDMNDIITNLYKADTLILSSPIYFGSLSDKLMSIINRFQRFYSQKYTLQDGHLPAFKNLILIATQGSDKTQMFDGAKQTLHILQSLFDVPYMDMILVPSSDQDNYVSDSVKDDILRIQKALK
jgi:multimeric flavodoxin WrbA